MRSSNMLYVLLFIIKYQYMHVYYICDYSEIASSVDFYFVPFCCFYFLQSFMASFCRCRVFVILNKPPRKVWFLLKLHILYQSRQFRATQIVYSVFFSKQEWFDVVKFRHIDLISWWTESACHSSLFSFFFWFFDFKIDSNWQMAIIIHYYYQQFQSICHEFSKIEQNSIN